MNQRDQTLERLIRLHANRDPLPATVKVGGETVATRQFVEGFRFDRREATPAMSAHIANVELPLMCEAALPLLG
ncbi:MULTISPECIES: hypothetical protein [unclassified Bradyrhizobium]|uniref:hypothetical protein n=1 Tax=unclassified Bradyrhizobium TaxID=2631580 RepID=UPI001FF830E7|nr:MULTISPECIES: hypothetical protein [unclassified Bradyrhizobium]MCK1611037.1 hypothetical protein [Bradyrhizobium sp. 163]MCK1762791.1 hypothetical protein [Bradyrhizobium sp. 136]